MVLGGRGRHETIETVAGGREDTCPEVAFEGRVWVLAAEAVTASEASTLEGFTSLGVVSRLRVVLASVVHLPIESWGRWPDHRCGVKKGGSHPAFNGDHAVAAVGFEWLGQEKERSFQAVGMA